MATYILRSTEYQWGSKDLSQQWGYCYVVLFKQETWNTKSWPAYPTFTDIVTWPHEWREEQAWVNITLHDKTWKREWFWLGHVEKVWEHKEGYDWAVIKGIAQGDNHDTRLGADPSQILNFPRYITQ